MASSGTAILANGQVVGARLRRIMRAVKQAKAAAPLEFEQIIIRYLVGLAITAYVIYSYAFEGLYQRSGLTIALLIGSAWVLGLAFLLHITLWPKRHVLRRCASTMADAGMLSLMLAYGNETAAIFFPIYLWVTLGNGFRFGLPYMYGAIAANLVGFAIMAWVTPYWREAPQFSVGLALAIIIIPLYAAKLIRNLHKAKEEAEAASRAKTEFLSMMSHELRTPLTAILGLAHVSKLTASSAKERFSAVSTELAAGRLLRMVDTILKFQRIESGAADREDEAFDVLDMLNEVLAITEPLAAQKGLDFRVRFTSGIPASIVSDADHVQTIILNLVTNAIKYTQSGSVWLEVGMTGATGESRFLISVKDTGSGISAKAQARIFDRFVRAEEHTLSDEPGVGLGLATCKSLAELMGGELGFESTLGVGSHFWAELPATPADGAERLEPSQPEAAPVLIIENAVSDQVLRAVKGTRRTEAELLTASHKEEDALCDHVIVVDPEGIAVQLSTALTGLMQRAGNRPSLIVLGAGTIEARRFEALATAMADPRRGGELVPLIRTVARWHKRVSGETTATSPEVTPLTRRLTVLVADDNVLNRQVISRMLELDGHQIVLAETGDEALDILLQGRAELSFVDVNMPGMSGIDVSRAYLTGLGSASHTPIIGLTADISEQTRTNCLQAGMSDVLGKPVTLDQLRQAVSRYASAATSDQPTARTKGDAGSTKAPPSDIADLTRVAELRKLFGDRQFETQFVESFHRDLQSSLSSLRQALNSGHPSGVREALHALKSSASTAGAQHIIEEVDNFPIERAADTFEAFECRINAAFETYRHTVMGETPPLGEEGGNPYGRAIRIAEA